MFRSKEGTAGKEEENRRLLCRIAELCGCDLRRIINEMQLYSHHVSKEANMSSALSCDTWERTSGEVSDELDAPTISNIFPKSSQSDQYSVVTIMGNHFINDTDRVCTEVTIGGLPCPVVRVVSKNIMLVVCPPCVLPSGVDASGVHPVANSDSYCHKQCSRSRRVRSRTRKSASFSICWTLMDPVCVCVCVSVCVC